MTTRIGNVPVALAVRDRFPADGPAPTMDELREIIEEQYFGPDENRPLVGMTTFYVAMELKPYFARPIQPSETAETAETLDPQ